MDEATWPGALLRPYFHAIYVTRTERWPLIPGSHEFNRTPHSNSGARRPPRFHRTKQNGERNRGNVTRKREATVFRS